MKLNYPRPACLRHVLSNEVMSQMWIQILAETFASCVTLGIVLQFFVPKNKTQYLLWCVLNICNRVSIIFGIYDMFNKY